jgi:hypothetical protein
MWRGRPPDAVHCLCAGFRQFGSFVGVCTVGCVLLLGRGLVLVRGCGACRAVCVGLHSGPALVDVHLDVVPLPPRSSSPTMAGCWLLWEGCYPALTLAPTCGAKRAS